MYFLEKSMDDKKTWLVEGLIVAGIPAIGYWFAFLYELGYCKYFNIPSSFIEIDMLNVLIAIVGTVTLLGTVNFLVQPFFLIFVAAPWSIKKAIKTTLLPIVLMTGGALALKMPFFYSVFFICALALPIAFAEFILPLFTHRDIQGYAAKLEAATLSEFEQNHTTMDALANKLGFESYSLLFYLFIFSYVVFFSGSIDGRVRSDFIVLKGKPEMAVIKTYNSSFLAAKFDRTTKLISADFKIIPIDKRLGAFTYERIGPLQARSF